MAQDRRFPPSARRRSLARQAGVHAASPHLVGAMVCAAVAVVLVAISRRTTAELGAAIAAACSQSAGTIEPGAVVRSVVSLVGPLLGLAAIVVVLGHLAQTRALWLPRRKLAGAPIQERGRLAELGVELAGAAVFGAVTFGWLWWTAPSLAASIASPVAAPRLLGAFVTAIAGAWLVVGALDAIARHARVAAALRMTSTEKRDDERLTAADPRWRAHRARNATHTGDDIAGASVVILGDSAAVAIAWHPIHRPVPVQLARGSTSRATQLVGLARRHGIPVHREPGLVAALLDGDGAVPRRLWSRLAEIIAATLRD
ncbi:MAG: EscU/YscU/HrcU family type III secretion system export apparatus switch protein [Kofleriaceae bacterium]